MPRNSAGLYTLPIGAFSPGGLIKSSDHNSNYNDIASALTGSLATNGVSSMTGPIVAMAGSVAAVGYGFTGDTNTGFYKAGSHQIGWAYNGTQGGVFNSDGVGGVAYNAAVAVGGTLGVTGLTTLTGGLAVSAAALTSPVLSGIPVINATSYTFGTGAANSLLSALNKSQTVAAAAGALAIDVNNGYNVELTLNGSVTALTLSNWATTGFLGRLLLNITSTGAFTMAGWPGTTRWSGGVAPTITSGAGKRDSIVLTSSDGGVTFRGSVAGQNMS